MRIAVLSPICWRTPPSNYGPWELVASNLTEGLINLGMDVTLFATGNSLTSGRLEYIAERPYEEDTEMDPKVWECLHISHMMEMAENFDIIHNHYDFLPLTYSRLISTPIVTTIHGFSSEKILAVYKEYNDKVRYVSISNSDRSSELDYIATVYNGIRVEDFVFNKNGGNYLLFFGRIHHDKGTHEAIQIAKMGGMKLIISGIIQDRKYFDSMVKPYINDKDIVFAGAAGPDKRNDLLGNAYALLHPINFDEPFGLSVAESMMCGTPVIAFNRGSMPELIRDGETGFLVENVDEAVEALKKIKNIDPYYCMEWSRNNFSRERMVNDYINVYKTVLNK